MRTLFTFLSMLAVALVLGAEAPDPDIGSQPSSVSVPRTELVLIDEMAIDASGNDDYTDADYHGIANNGTSLGIASVVYDLSADVDAFWDFDGGSCYGNATAPVITSSSAGATAVTWTYDAAYPYPQVMTATFSPPLPPGEWIRFGADTDAFVADPCPGGSFGQAPAHITLTLSNTAVCDQDYATQSGTLSTAFCDEVPVELQSFAVD